MVNREPYHIQPLDLVPIYGLYRHAMHCNPYPRENFNDFIVRSAARGVLLSIYNVVFPAASLVSLVQGLEKITSG